MELISRQAAIDAVRATLLSWSYMPEWRDNKIIEALEQLPPIQPEPHWIPVTEQDPKESGKYLVTAVIGFVPDHVDDPNTYEAVTTVNYSADTRDPIKWWGNNVEKVLAWMPLPEPYKGVTT